MRTSKFNTRPTTTSCDVKKTVNHEGATAWQLDPYTKLYTQAASCLMGEPKFYTDAKTSDSELMAGIHAMLKKDPEFVLQLAVYCREVLHLRSVPLALLAEYANCAPGTVPNSRKYVTRTIQRADEITELLAYQFARNKQEKRTAKLPMCLKYGVRDAFDHFDEYQFAKYDRDGTVKLRDAVFLTHPKGKTPERTKLYEKIVKGELQTPDTWEVLRSTGKMDWHQIVDQVWMKDAGTRFPYMAALRNLRNCLEDQSVTAADIHNICVCLTRPEHVRKSKQFPFRFVSAYKELPQSPQSRRVMDALEKAMIISTENIPRLPGMTFIASDTSGSMTSCVSDKSKVQRLEVGLILSAIANRFCDDTVTGCFGDTFQTVSLSQYASGILSNSQVMRQLVGRVGYSTNGHTAIEYAIQNKLKVDRFFFFTDCQMWNSNPMGYSYCEPFAQAFKKYKAEFNPNCKLYSFDLAGYGTLMVPPNEKGVCVIGGWNERIFDFIPAFESGEKNVAINAIRAIKP